MSAPTAYTDDTLCAYMVTCLGSVAEALDLTADSFTDAIDGDGHGSGPLKLLVIGSAEEIEPDGAGRILGGQVPSQGLRIARGAPR